MNPCLYVAEYGREYGREKQIKAFIASVFSGGLTWHVAGRSQSIGDQETISTVDMRCEAGLWISHRTAYWSGPKAVMNLLKSCQ